MASVINYHKLSSLKKKVFTYSSGDQTFTISITGPKPRCCVLPGGCKGEPTFVPFLTSRAESCACLRSCPCLGHTVPQNLQIPLLRPSCHLYPLCAVKSLPLSSKYVLLYLEFIQAVWDHHLVSRSLF